MNYSTCLELDVDDLAEDLVGHLEHLDLLSQQRRVRRLLQLQGAGAVEDISKKQEKNSENIKENFRKLVARSRERELERGATCSR